MATAELFLYDHDLTASTCYARANYVYGSRSVTLDAVLTVGTGGDLPEGFDSQDVADALADVLDMDVTLPVPPEEAEAPPPPPEE